MTHYKLTKEIFPNIYEVLENTNIIAKSYSSYGKKNEEEYRLRKIQKVNNVSKIVDTIDNIIFLEKARGSDLYVVLERRRKLSEEECKYISYRLLNIVRELHSLNIVHGDIKPENIIYDELSNELTLVDFEQSKTTAIYTSPEQSSNRFNKYSPLHDVWCIGTTIYTLMLGFNPYKDTEHILSKYKYRNIKNKGLSEDAESFIDFILVKNPLNRPTIHECLNHRWFNSLRKIVSYSISVDNMV